MRKVSPLQEMFEVVSPGRVKLVGNQSKWWASLRTPGQSAQKLEGAWAWRGVSYCLRLWAGLLQLDFCSPTCDCQCLGSWDFRSSFLDRTRGGKKWKRTWINRGLGSSSDLLHLQICYGHRETEDPFNFPSILRKENSYLLLILPSTSNDTFHLWETASFFNLLLQDRPAWELILKLQEHSYEFCVKWGKGPRKKIKQHFQGQMTDFQWLLFWSSIKIGRKMKILLVSTQKDLVFIFSFTFHYSHENLRLWVSKIILMMLTKMISRIWLLFC